MYLKIVKTMQIAIRFLVERGALRGQIVAATAGGKS